MFWEKSKTENIGQKLYISFRLTVKRKMANDETKNDEETVTISSLR